jgi:hypothetical protein
LAAVELVLGSRNRKLFSSGCNLRGKPHSVHRSSSYQTWIVWSPVTYPSWGFPFSFPFRLYIYIYICYFPLIPFNSVISSPTAHWHITLTSQINKLFIITTKA